MGAGLHHRACLFFLNPFFAIPFPSVLPLHAHQRYFKLPWTWWTLRSNQRPLNESFPSALSSESPPPSECFTGRLLEQAEGSLVVTAPVKRCFSSRRAFQPPSASAECCLCTSYFQGSRGGVLSRGPACCSPASPASLHHRRMNRVLHAQRGSVILSQLHIFILGETFLQCCAVFFGFPPPASRLYNLNLHTCKWQHFVSVLCVL